ncbi:hypothetical protein WKI71_45310 [Streptomyces sp. MS1.AVA.1]|uniref:ATP-binding cassette domain-containing protein n=1 Tax=Streptomyces machairae TaxID=3134109 RepID=A0ABU8UXB2_9ACTN
MACLDRVGLADRRTTARAASPAASGGASRGGPALCQRPRVLLADEPVSALEPGRPGNRYSRCWPRLAHDAGLAVLAVLHQPSLAAATPTAWSACGSGRVILDGPPARASTPCTGPRPWSCVHDRTRRSG